MNARRRGKLQLYFDGLCEPSYAGGPRNPGGCACYGWVLYDGAERIATGQGVVARGVPGATNNVAEYSALREGLEYVYSHFAQGTALEVRGDSQLVIRQFNGEWRVRSALLQPLLLAVQSLARGLSVDARWIPREENQEADRLSREAYTAETGLTLAEV